MSTQIIVSLVATLALGGVIGGGIGYELTNTIHVSCPADQAARPDASRFFATTPIPLTGKTYP